MKQQMSSIEDRLQRIQESSLSSPSTATDSNQPSHRLHNEDQEPEFEEGEHMNQDDHLSDDDDEEDNFDNDDDDENEEALDQYHRNHIQGLIQKIECMLSEQTERNFTDQITDEDIERTISNLQARINKIRLENSGLEQVSRDAHSRQAILTQQIEQADQESLETSILIAEIQRQLQRISTSTFDPTLEPLPILTNDSFELSIKPAVHQKSHFTTLLSTSPPPDQTPKNLPRTIHSSNCNTPWGAAFSVDIPHSKRVADLKEQIALASERRDQLAQVQSEIQDSIQSAQRRQASLVIEKKEFQSEVKTLTSVNSNITNDIMTMKGTILLNSGNRRTKRTQGVHGLAEFVHSLTPEIVSHIKDVNSRSSSKTSAAQQAGMPVDQSAHKQQQQQQQKLEKTRRSVTDFTINLRKANSAHNIHFESSNTPAKKTFSLATAADKHEKRYESPTQNPILQPVEESTRLETQSVSHQSDCIKNNDSEQTFNHNIVKPQQQPIANTTPNNNRIDQIDQKQENLNKQELEEQQQDKQQSVNKNTNEQKQPYQKQQFALPIHQMYYYCFNKSLSVQYPTQIQIPNKTNILEEDNSKRKEQQMIPQTWRNVFRVGIRVFAVIAVGYIAIKLKQRF